MFFFKTRIFLKKNNVLRVRRDKRDTRVSAVINVEGTWRIYNAETRQ